MKVKFDSLNRFETPIFYLCNPGSRVQSNLLSSVLGCITDTSDEEIVYNFGTLSELNFRVFRVEKSDHEETMHAKMIYNAIKNRRLIFVEDVGYFVITNAVSGYENGCFYKDVSAESCEIELQNKLLPYIADGTYKFIDLMELLVSSAPMWKIGHIDEAVLELYRTFEDVSTEQNVLAFLQEDVQDAYECIFMFDIINRTINAYDQNTYFQETNIHITKDDVINSLNITENSEEHYTVLSVLGDDNLNISPVNPLGTNKLYNFDYYLNWMSQELRDKVSAWNELVASKFDDYYSTNLAYYKDLSTQSNLNAEKSKIETRIDMYSKCRTNIVAENSTDSVDDYNKEIVGNGGTAISISGEIEQTLLAIDELLAAEQEALSAVEDDLAEIAAELEDLRASIEAVHDAVSINTYFTDDEYDELSNYIVEGEYNDQYITVTSIMTYEERFSQMKTLYDRALQRLERVSSPTQEFTMDLENFLFAKEFEAWSDQLETGCLINVELEHNDVALLFLSNITVNFSDRSLQMTFGNRFSRFDSKTFFDSVLGDVKRSANSINYIKEVLYPVKNGEFDTIKEAIESSGILTKDAALASQNQEFIIDDTGILGRKLIDDGTFSPRQVKMTNQGIVFTDDGWETANTAIGRFLYNNPFTGIVEDRYGVIADTIISNIILSEDVGIYNPDCSITLDSNGLVITSNSEKDSDNEIIFTIQRKTVDDNGVEHIDKQMYVDDNGNLVLNGTVNVYTGSDSISLSDIENGSQALEKTDYLDSKIDSHFQILSNEMSIRFTQAFDQINTITKYFSFTIDGLTIGAVDNPNKVIVDNDEISILVNGTPVQTFNANGDALIPDLQITKSMSMFGYLINEDPSGNVNCEFVGE